MGGGCGGVSGCTTGISGNKKFFDMCVVHWRPGTCVCMCAQGVCAPEKGLSVPSLESAWQ